MHQCGFCLTQVPEDAGAIIASQAVVSAIKSGYEPQKCPNWGKMAEMARERIVQNRPNDDPYADPPSDGECAARWTNRLLNQVKNWRLCDSCFSTLSPFLPEVAPPLLPDNYDEYGSESRGVLEFVVPMNCNPFAILAGYAGLTSLLVIPAPFALILGIIALRSIRKKPGQRGKARAIFGIVMGGFITSITALHTLVFILSALLKP